jgi:hypothetical protein
MGYGGIGGLGGLLVVILVVWLIAGNHAWVARELERAGLIARGRRQITILDRQGLVEASCECYQLVRARVTFHLPKTYP